VLLARDVFERPERLDMSALAGALGVNRATLYRWVGSRDALLVEVVWSTGRRALERIGVQTARLHGVERVVAVVLGLTEAAIADPGMQRWLAEEGEHAMRLLTGRDGGFQVRLVDALEALLADEDLSFPADRREVAYVLARLIESYTYLDLITGERPDAARAEPILRMLLNGATSGSSGTARPS
jgi:AcrR family transcriptional regulator